MTGSGSGSGSAAALHLEPTCTDASIGLDHGTVALRDPDKSVAEAIRTACLEGPWKQEAITCFAKLTATSGLGECAKLLDDTQREAVFDALGGTDLASVEISLLKLQQLKIGIAECDSFVATVSLVLGCDAMALDQRVQLGVETADAWSLPTKNLPPAMTARMSGACKKSLDDLIAHAKPLGCL